MGFLVEGSTGARAVQLLREQPLGTVIQTPQLAEMLGAKQTLLHQLLANAVNLRLIKKVRVPGSVFTGWKLGAGNDSANIERRAAPTASPSDSVRRVGAAQRRAARQAERAARAQPSSLAPSWPPGFVSTFDSGDGYRAPRVALDDDAEEDAPAPIASWLRGLVATAPADDAAPAPMPGRAASAPRALQLPLFDDLEAAERGRARRPAAAHGAQPVVPAEYSNWRQVLLIEAF